MLFRSHFPPKLNEIRYFDNACLTVPTIDAIDYQREFLMTSIGCDRGAYYTSMQIDRDMLNAREAFGQLINAEHPRKEIVFLQNGTHALNTVLKGQSWTKGDKIVTTNVEHNSVEATLQQMSRLYGIKIVRIPLNQGLVRPEALVETLKEHPTTKFMVLSGMDNVLGHIRPIKELIRVAHSIGIKVLIDGAQTLMHQRVDVQDTGADFQTFSAHKFYGLPGVGILYGKRDLLNKMEPLIVGGGTVRSIESAKILQKSPERFEAGIRNVPGILASARIVPFLIQAKEQGHDEYLTELTRYAFEKLSKIRGIYFLDQSLGYPRFYNGFVVFGIHGYQTNDLAILIDELSRCSSRAGSHCQTHFFTKIRSEDLKKRGIDDEELFLVRLTFAPYNTREEIDVLYQTLEELTVD
jgi:cysteine desulfurase/selenocysteine lyase